MTIDDIEDKDSVFIVKIPDCKTRVQRVFTITNDQPSVDLFQLIRKYRELRPSNFGSSNFFIKYLAGKCMKQNVGINTIGKIPKLIAEYLKLPQPEEFTGHCFRRTSATLLANAGGSITLLKRHGGWKSATVAEGYIADSITSKNDVANKIFSDKTFNNENIATPSTSRELNVRSIDSSIEQTAIDIAQNFSAAGINIQSTNCTFNINISK